ncbi:hypothetical protein ACLBSL_33555, partial [Klebsiella pneumoniae]|uniref:hypothetical protein n=1 Tax=Klebsiella pneumoniae TaxID=573 RepID=UPI0039695143
IQGKERCESRCEDILKVAFYPNRNISPAGYSGLSPEEEALSNQVWNETYSLTDNTDINKPDKLFYVMAGRIMDIV